MKKSDYLKQIRQLGNIKLHEKEAEMNFSAFDDDYVGDEENNWDPDDNLFMSTEDKKKATIGKISLNTLKVRLVSDGTVAAAGVNVPLFGAFTNLYVANFSVPAGVTVLGTPTGYREILSTSISKPWSILGLKIIVGGAAPAAQLNQNFSVVRTDLTGRSTTDPYFPSDAFSAFQQQNGIIEMRDFETQIDGNATMNYIMLPSQTVDLLFYVKAQVDPSRVAAGKNSLALAQRNFPDPNKQTLVIKQQDQPKKS